MNREGALEFFRNEIEEIEAEKTAPLDWLEDFKAAFAALSSCACTFCPVEVAPGEDDKE